MPNSLKDTVGKALETRKKLRATEEEIRKLNEELTEEVKPLIKTINEHLVSEGLPRIEKYVVSVGTVLAYPESCKGLTVEKKNRFDEIAKEHASEQDLIVKLAAISKDVDVEILSVEEPAVKLKRNGKSAYMVGPFFPLNTVVARKLARNKFLTKTIMKGIGVSTPKGFLCRDIKEAKEAVGRLSYPVVVKPNCAGLGKFVVADITNDVELEKAVKSVMEDYSFFIVEEYLDWCDYRFFIVDDEFVAACKRTQPYVLGDGKSTVAELIEKYDAKRNAEVKVDDEVARNLKKQGLSLDSVPGTGAEVVLRSNANITTGGISEDVTDEVAEEFKEIAVKVAKELGLKFAGVDMLCKDIADPRAPYSIIEVNDLPGYDAHRSLDYGKERNVVLTMLDAIFKG